MRRRAGDLFFAPWWNTSSRSLSYFSIWRRCWFSRISRRFSSTRISSSPKSVSPFLPLVKIWPRIDISFLEHDFGRILLADRSLGLLFLLLDGADLFLLLEGLLADRLLRRGALHLAEDLLLLVVGLGRLGGQGDPFGELLGLLEILEELLGLDRHVLHGLLVGQRFAGELEDGLERRDVLVEDLEPLVVDVLDAVVELLHLPADLLDPPGEHELARLGDGLALALLEQLLLGAVELLEIRHGAAAARLVAAARLLEEHEGFALVPGAAVERRHLLGEVLHAQHFPDLVQHGLSVHSGETIGPRGRVEPDIPVLRGDLLEGLADDRDRVAQRVENGVFRQLVHEELERVARHPAADGLDLLLLAR